MLEAKDQGHRRKCSPKKKSFQKCFSGVLQNKKRVFKNFFHAIYKILTISNLPLSSSRGQGNFQELEASRPKTLKCVLEDSTSGIFISQVALAGRQRRDLWSSSQDAICPPVNHTRRGLHTVALDAERQAGKL